jgi:hypothetical protein
MRVVQLMLLASLLRGLRLLFLFSFLYTSLHVNSITTKHGQIQDTTHLQNSGGLRFAKRVDFFINLLYMHY